MGFKWLLNDEWTHGLFSNYTTIEMLQNPLSHWQHQSQGTQKKFPFKLKNKTSLPDSEKLSNY
jgi:hypothetical protein